MRFILSIDCDNAAFDGDPGDEITRILRDLTRRIDDKMGMLNIDDTFALRDINGNIVGVATLTA